MKKITTIGITSPCGGNGCTTLAVHLAWHAAHDRGIRTLAVSMDRTGALVRHFLPDGGLRVDSYAHILPNLDVCYFAVEATVSKLLPTLGLSKANHPALIVVDLGCGMSSDLLEDVDLWLTPVADLRTTRALLDTGYPRSGQAKTYIAFNRADRGNQYARRLLAEAEDLCSDLSVLRTEIPHSGAVQRASRGHETVWQHSRESRAAVVLKSWADEVLDLAMPRKWHAADARPRIRLEQNPLDESARNLEPFLKPDQSDRTTAALSRLRVLLAEQSPLQFAVPLRKGKWLRRERKRLGLGGKKTALRLGITEYRLRTLELQNEVVPTAWLSVLAELDFRVTSRGADSVLGVSRLRDESDRHTRPTDDRSVFEGSAPTTQMDSSPQAMDPLFPLVGSVAEPPAAYGLAEVDYSVPMEPPRIEQEVVPPISKAIPTTALSIRSTPTPLTEARQVAPRKSVRPLSNISALQTRIDAANASLRAASQNIGRPTRRKPLSM